MTTRSTSLVLVFVGALAAASPHVGCSSGAAPTTDNGAGGGSSTGGGPLTGCGVTCDASHHCGAGLSCLPAANGGTVCKPSTCPTCAAGKFCAYDTKSCEPSGCTSLACGFTYLDACDDCVKANCCGQNSACAAIPACAALVKCEGACGTDTACQSACQAGVDPAALAAFNAVVSCNQGKCLAACYGGTVGAGGSASGCPANNPVVCPNNLCCPTQFPRCGGGCGYNCCPPATGAGGSGGTGAGGGGSGSGAAGTGTAGSTAGCPDLTACLTAQVSPFTSGCTANGFHLTVTNHCQQQVQYEYCFEKLDGSCDCGEGTINGGQTLSSVGDYACNATGHIRYFGASPASWGSCPVLKQCK